ncbi:unnamed protein product [Calicophoron daubneyi]|uniref:Uncharacterized protein n=1 Tax=Calicophoron daubneyi TaxID=300641 RepID=A0AAV2TJ42_CALDB
MTEKKRKRRRHAEIPSLPMVPTHIEPPSAGVGAMAAALNSVFKGLVPTVFTHCPVKPKHNAAPKTTERVQPGAEVNSPRMETVTNHQLADSSESLRKADPMVIRPLVLDEVNIRSTAPKTTERVQPGAEVNSPRMETVTNHQLADSSESLRKADPMVIRPLVLDEVNIQSVASEPILARLKAEQTASNCPSKRPTKCKST